MPTKIERLQAELKLEKAEAKFLEQKAAEGGATMKQKLAIREARRNYRENYRQGGPGTVQPETVGATVEVQPE